MRKRKWVKFLETFVDFFMFKQFPLTTSEMELDYHHQKVDVGVALRVAERRIFADGGGPLCPHKKKNLKILGNYKKISEILGLDREHPAGHPKIYFGTSDRKLQKISSKAFHRKNYFTIS